MVDPTRCDRGRAGKRGHSARPGLEPLEARSLMAATPPAPFTPTDVEALLNRASAATASQGAIVAIVDRSGRILGVRVENGVSTAITGNPTTLTFAIDGALAEARAGAFFSSNQAPLTSRTVENLSESAIIQQEVNSNPDITDPNSPLRGPGFVAPIGLKSHFPANIPFTTQVDLSQIEGSNRDSIVNPGPNLIRQGVGTPGSDDVLMGGRFNIDPKFVPPGQAIFAPESYGFVSGLDPTAQSRGIGTLPGGIPLFKNGTLVGGIGVFFPGTTGYASEENSKLNDPAFYDPNKPDLSIQAESIAFAAAGGSTTAGVPARTFTALNKVAPPVPGFDLPSGRIDLVGITLDIFGPGGLQGPKNLVNTGRLLGIGAINGKDEPVDAAGATTLSGVPVPDGWLVTPHAAADGSLTAADVTTIIQDGINQALTVRAAIRTPLNQHTEMVFSVTDKAGNILGLYRMPDATVFSIDVAVAKARNVSYYDNAAALQPVDQVPGVPPGTSLTARTFRYLAEPRFPEGIDGYPPGPFSILNDPGVGKDGRQPANPPPASTFQSVEGFAAFNPQTNFHQPWSLNQNGVIFFPGSSALYKTIDGNRVLVGGLGVSGDGVDQDDDVTFAAAAGSGPPVKLRADRFFVRGVRLPDQKFNRNPHLPPGGGTQKLKIMPILPRARQRRVPLPKSIPAAPPA